MYMLWFPEALALRNRECIGGRLRSICRLVQKIPGAKVNGNITAAVNVTDQLSEELSEFSENEKICVNFLFYDSETARNTTVDGKNILEISLEIQEKYAIRCNFSCVVR